MRKQPSPKARARVRREAQLKSNRHGQYGTNATTALLEWFGARSRALPWREDRDPWKVWVSEVMLQQTQVARAIGFWERFVQAFPSVDVCAAASVDEVLALWSGLGYYRRGRLLHAGAQAVVALGAPRKWPQTPEQWRTIPGIGPYTAAAIASQCFGVRVAAIDANVERVVGRLLGQQGAPSTLQRREVAVAALELIDSKRPGDSNQALMEVGALLCRPWATACGECPLEPSCRAAHTTAPHTFGPQRVASRSVPVSLVVALARSGDRVLMARRSVDEVLLAGMWELPWAQIDQGSESQIASGPILRQLEGRYGGAWRIGRSVGAVRHRITFRAIEALVCEAHYDGVGNDDLEWVALGEIDRRAKSSLFDKCMALTHGPSDPTPDPRPPNP